MQRFGGEHHIPTSMRYITCVAYIWRFEREVGRQLDLEAKCSTFVWTIGLGGSIILSVKRTYE